MFSATLRARWFSLFPSQWLGNWLVWIVFVIGCGASTVQAAPFAYVANNASNTLSVIDLATGGVVRTITGLRQPTAVAVTPDGRFVYVINDDTPRDISVINAETGAIVNTIFGIPAPRDLVFSPDCRLAYVANGENNGTVVVVDTATRAAVKTIPVGRNPEKIVISPDGSYLYVVNTGTTIDNVSVIRASDGAAVNTIMVGRFALGAVISRDGSRLYVANRDDDTVSVIDTGNGIGNGVIRTFNVTSDPTSVAINPSGTRLYVVRRGVTQGVLVEVDTATGATLGSPITFSFRANSIAISPNGTHLYVSQEGGNPNTVAEIVIATRAIKGIGVGREPNGIVPSPLQADLSTVNAASYSPGPLVPEAIGAIFSTNMANGVQVATTLPLPTSMAGTVVKIRDATGVERLAPLFFVSPRQVNYQVPAGTAAGNATVTVSSTHGFVSAGGKQMDLVAPGLFSANADGQGVAAAIVLRIKADGTRTTEAVARFDQSLGKSVPIPIDLGPSTDQLFLILFGAGMRSGISLGAVSATIGGVSSEVLFVGAAPGFVGLDQVNLRLPHSLAGRGVVDIVLKVNDRSANTVQISVL